MISIKNWTGKIVMAALLLAGAALAFAQSSSGAVAPAHWRTVLLELLFLLPLAALAWKLKTKNNKSRSRRTPSQEIEEGESIRLSNGLNAQIIRANQRVVLIIHAKNGSASMLDLGQLAPEPKTEKASMPTATTAQKHEGAIT